MLFNSFEFLFLFMPIVFFGFFCLARFSQKASLFWLALSSLFFYGVWSPKYVWLLLFSILVNFSFAYIINLNRKSKSSKIILMFAIGVNLALLGFFKYTNFFISTSNWLFGNSLTIVKIILPLGISFFTFTQIAFIIDVYRNVVRDYNFSQYLLFVTYFPHLIAGPVLHHKQIMPQFALRSTYDINFNNIASGVSIFTVGLAKKMLLADNFGEYANPVFSSVALLIQPDFIESWTGVLAYTLQLYFDFSGYSDMAIGISLLFGVNLPVNFNSPYKAKNVIDFWRRWHMTLSQFLRDYLYIPLGGNKNGIVMRYLNLMITMLLGGLWHGANWTFVVWGGLHGIFLVINHMWQFIFSDRSINQTLLIRLYSLASTLLTFFCVVIAWIFFRAESFPSAILMLKGCFGIGGISLPSKLGVLINNFGYTSGMFLSNVSFNGVFLNIPGLASMGGIGPFLALLILGLLIVWFAPNTHQIFNAPEKTGKEKFFGFTISWKPKPVLGIILGFLFFYSLSKINKISPFLYYQF